MMAFVKKYPVGEIRPSQLLLTYGIGSIIDLPHLSTLIMGLDDWDTREARAIKEERLLAAVQTVLGGQVAQLLSPPPGPIGFNPYDPAQTSGVPVAAFPRWMVCPRCHLLAPVEQGFFRLQSNRYHPDLTCYRHDNCAKQPIVLPSRFMIACEAGHLDDFPWVHFVHGERKCNAIMRLNEVGVSGEPSDIYITCDECGKSRPMSDAFSNDDALRYVPHCRGRRPHLRDFEKKVCQYQARTILLAASNSWFPLVFTTLSLPTTVDSLGELVEDYWAILQGATGIEMLAAFRHIPAIKAAFDEYHNSEIWQKIEQKRGATQSSEITRPGDLKGPEWQILSNPQSAPLADDFHITPISAPDGYEQCIQQVALVERLREVRALTGFTRIESLGDYAEEEELPAEHIMPLASHRPYWVPAAEVRGEGIFIQFREEALQAWVQKISVRRHNDSFRVAHQRWRQVRHIPMPEANYPDIRYVLLHTFSHALMRQLALQCGYSAASIRERIYAQLPASEDGPMAGILLYTAASDSEGTLGGLVNEGKQLGYHIDGALDAMRNCASDPLCAEHLRLDDNTLHGAACHACLFAPETSCERGNKYLDRSVLVHTIERDNLAFFER